MPDLASFQRDFAAAMAGCPIVRPWAADSALAVYRNTSALGAIEALAANYPVVRSLLGGEAFENVAASFVRTSPPRAPVLATYGAPFADFLEEHALGKELPYLSDVARIDRLHIETLFAPNALSLDLEELGTVHPEDWSAIGLVLHPATRLGWYTTPAMTIWLAHRASNGIDIIEPKWRAGGALFVRPANAVEAYSMDRAAHRLLFGLGLGETVGAAATAALSLYPDTDIGATFAALVGSGVFASLLDPKGK